MVSFILDARLVVFGSNPILLPKQSPFFAIKCHKLLVIVCVFQLRVPIAGLFGMTTDTQCHESVGLVLTRAPDMMRMQQTFMCAQ